MKKLWLVVSVLGFGCQDPLRSLTIAADGGAVPDRLRLDEAGIPLRDTAGPVTVEGPGPEAQRPLPIDRTGLVAYYPFTDGAQDASGHGNHAMIKGPVPAADRFGHPQAAYHFDGVDDQIVCLQPVDLPSGTTPRTIAGWFRSEASVYYTAALFGYGEANHGSSFQLTIGPGSYQDGVFRVNGWGDSWDWRTGVLPAPYLDGRWHHAAVTYDGRRVEVFFDGSALASTTWSYETRPTSITIGAETGSGKWLFRGDLDEVMIFARLLSPQEIAQLAAN
jgi:hypothetical protein